jgi:hypothetical protein
LPARKVVRVESHSRVMAPVTIGMAYDRHVVELACVLDPLEIGSTPVIPIATIRDEHSSEMRLWGGKPKR